MIATVLVCGVLHIVGSERDTALVLDNGRQRVALEGAIADSIVGTTWSHICVDGTRTTHLAIGAAYSLQVAHVRPAGDGAHAPIVGILTSREFLTTSDTHTIFRVRFAPAATFDALLGTRVWILSHWHDGALTVERIGPF